MLHIIKRNSHLIKIAIISTLVAFLMSSCASVPIFSKFHQSTPPRILSSHQTHALLSKWSANNYQSLPNHSITYQSHHPLVKTNDFTEIKSGYTISPLTNRTDGIGLAAVIKAKAPNNVGNNFTPITRSSFLTNLYPANLVATQTKKNGILSTHIDIYDSISSRHQSQPLAHQPGIVMDYVHSLPGNSTLRIMGLFRPQEYKSYRGLYLAEPYDQNRIPILMIHGLASSPETFVKLSESINADPQLRKKYQLWYYFYPTGTPWITSASQFRKSYRALITKLDPNQDDPNIRKTVFIGHSMGGLISRASLSQPGDTLRQAYLGKVPLSKIYSGAKLKEMRSHFHYKPLQEPAKVIYLATPHRGSDMAEGFIGRVTIKLISIPSFFLQRTSDVFTLNFRISKLLPKSTIKLLTTGESSVDQLKPTNPSLTALNQMPMRNGNHLTSYSIIGDLGMPVYRMNTDGVVAYHSSSIPFSKSEKIVPSAHDITGNDDAIKTILKILRE